MKKGVTYEQFHGEEKAKEIKEKLRKANVGKKQSKETKRKRLETRKNNSKPWHSKEARNNIGKAGKGRKSPNTTGDKNPAKRPEVRKKISKSKKGVTKEINSNLARSEEQKKAKSIRMKGILKGITKKENPNLVCLEETKEKLRVIAKKYWEDPEWKEKHLSTMAKGRCIRPNKPETILLELLQELFPNKYKYVGDGEIWFGGKNPDFINVNGQKKIIELFGDYWHSEEVQGISEKQHEQERKATFAEYGYRTLIIWEHELEDILRVQKKVCEFQVQ